MRATNDGNGDEIASTYLPLSGGTMTGNVFAPTPANNDNSTKLATTEFVANDLKGNAMLLADSFANVIPSGADLNDYKTAGTYITTSSAVTNSLSNCPDSYVAVKLVVIHDGYGDIVYGGRQILFGSSIFVRSWSGGTDGSWQSWSTVELVKASGTNYIRYESGLQIYFGSINPNTDGTAVIYTFPVPFVNTPIALCDVGRPSSSPNNYTPQHVVSTTKINVYGVGNGSGWTNTPVYYIVIGYWK